MDEKEINEFMKMVLPALKELPEEEIRNQIGQIDEMSDEEKEQFINIILMLKEQDETQS